MDRRDPEALFWVLVVLGLGLSFVLGWGYFLQWLIKVWP